VNLSGEVNTLVHELTFALAVDSVERKFGQGKVDPNKMRSTNEKIVRPSAIDMKVILGSNQLYRPIRLVRCLRKPLARTFPIRSPTSVIFVR
jgi:hypothetical protein